MQALLDSTPSVGSQLCRSGAAVCYLSAPNNAGSLAMLLAMRRRVLEWFGALRRTGAGCCSQRPPSLKVGIVIWRGMS